MLGPSRRSPTSVMPYQLTTAATDRSSGPRAPAVEAGRGGDHPRGQGEVPAGGVAGDDDARGVDVVLLGVANHPTQRAQAVLDRGRGQRHLASRYCTLTTAQPFSSQGSRRRTLPSFEPARPAPAVDVHEHRGRPPGAARQIEVDLVVPVVRGVVGDVGHHAIGVRQVRRPRRRRVELGLGDRRRAERRRHRRSTTTAASLRLCIVSLLLLRRGPRPPRPPAGEAAGHSPSGAAASPPRSSDRRRPPTEAAGRPPAPPPRQSPPPAEGARRDGADSRYRPRRPGSPRPAGCSRVTLSVTESILARL